MSWLSGNFIPEDNPLGLEKSCCPGDPSEYHYYLDLMSNSKVDRAKI